ncbi:hypothetical protein [Gandjariella thermophila]|nr:hypothetical protein [Gandjariella thermophila]
MPTTVELADPAAQSEQPAMRSGALAAALRAGHAELDRARRALGGDRLDLAGLRDAVGQTAKLTEALAELARELAAQADRLGRTGHLRDDRPATVPPEVTTEEVAVDLRTVANHLCTAGLLLDPTLEDLRHLDAAPDDPAPGP